MAIDRIEVYNFPSDLMQRASARFVELQKIVQAAESVQAEYESLADFLKRAKLIEVFLKEKERLA